MCLKWLLNIFCCSLFTVGVVYRTPRPSVALAKEECDTLRFFHYPLDKVRTHYAQEDEENILLAKLLI